MIVKRGDDGSWLVWIEGWRVGFSSTMKPTVERAEPPADGDPKVPDELTVHERDDQVSIRFGRWAVVVMGEGEPMVFPILPAPTAGEFAQRIQAMPNEVQL